MEEEEQSSADEFDAAIADYASKAEGNLDSEEDLFDEDAGDQFPFEAPAEDDLSFSGPTNPNDMIVELAQKLERGEFSMDQMVQVTQLLMNMKRQEALGSSPSPFLPPPASSPSSLPASELAPPAPSTDLASSTPSTDPVSRASIPPSSEIPTLASSPIYDTHSALPSSTVASSSAPNYDPQVCTVHSMYCGSCQQWRPAVIPRNEIAKYLRPAHTVRTQVKAGKETQEDGVLPFPMQIKKQESKEDEHEGDEADVDEEEEKVEVESSNLVNEATDSMQESEDVSKTKDLHSSQAEATTEPSLDKSELLKAATPMLSDEATTEPSQDKSELLKADTPMLSDEATTEPSLDKSELLTANTPMLSDEAATEPSLDKSELLKTDTPKTTEPSLDESELLKANTPMLSDEKAEELLQAKEAEPNKETPTSNDVSQSAVDMTRSDDVLVEAPLPPAQEVQAASTNLESEDTSKNDSKNDAPPVVKEIPPSIMPISTAMPTISENSELSTAPPQPTPSSVLENGTTEDKHADLHDTANVVSSKHELNGLGITDNITSQPNIPANTPLNDTQSSGALEVVPPVEEVPPLPIWTCSMNLDPRYNSCEKVCRLAPVCEVGVFYAHGHRPHGEWRYPALGLNPFTIITYDKYLKHPDWTLLETIALLDYVLMNGAEAEVCWRGVSMDPILRVRHNDARQCETRFLHILVMQSIFQQAKGFSASKNRPTAPAPHFSTPAPSQRNAPPRNSSRRPTPRGRAPKRRKKVHAEDEDYRHSKTAVFDTRSESKRARPSKKYVDVDTDEDESEFSTSSEEEPLWVLEKILACREVRVPEKQLEARRAADAAELERVEKGLPPPAEQEERKDLGVIVDKNEEEINGPTMHKKKRGRITSSEEKMVTYKEFYVKLQGASFRHTLWLPEDELLILFNPFQTKNTIKRFLDKQEKVLEENEEKYMGEHFDQRFLEVDRVIDCCEIEVPTSHLGTVKTGKPTGDQEYEGKMVPFTRVEMFLVKWEALSYSQCSWEILEDVQNEMAMANFRRFNRPRIETDRPELDEEAKKVFEARQKHWYSESPPYKNHNKLRDYQVAGLNWLIDAWYSGRNTILADEMGLGKTCTVISLFEHLRSVENIWGPYLVIVPLSTINHWKREVQNWTNLNAVVYHDPYKGTDTRKMIRYHEFFYPGEANRKHRQAKFNVLITTYEVVLADVAELVEFDWKMVVVDEGHRLKNKSGKLLEAVKMIGCTRRLMMTGTPIQNNTTELWTMMNFLEPSNPLFNNFDAFVEKYGTLEESEQVQELQTLLRPYILRRMKEAVEKAIPPKVETIIDVELTTLQKKYYRAIYERNVRFLKKGVPISQQPRLVNIEMELRKCCNHPWLITGAEERELPDEDIPLDDYFHKTIEASGKLVLLDKLLPKLQSQGDRVLIFSQMTAVLNLLQEFCAWKKYRFERLDGHITGNEREAAIHRFNAPNSNRFIFLLSTRAGGVGLNLTSANTVIIFDSDWNPQQDVQAQARVHRIGQMKDVKIYRLVTKNTYEAEMFNRASRKLGLDHALLTNMEQASGELEETDRGNIEKMLKMGAYSLFTDDDQAEKKFLASDIDTILQSSRVINSHNANPSVAAAAAEQQEAVLAEGKAQDLEKRKTYLQQNLENRLNVARHSFESGDADGGLDINDPSFWDKVMPHAAGDRLYRADILLSKLTDGSALMDKQSRNDFFENLTQCCEPILAAKRKGKGEASDTDLNQIMDLLIQFCELSSKFPESQRLKAQMWLAEAEARERKTRMQLQEEEDLKRKNNGGEPAEKEEDEKEWMPQRKSSRLRRNTNQHAEEADVRRAKKRSLKEDSDSDAPPNKRKKFGGSDDEFQGDSSDASKEDDSSAEDEEGGGGKRANKHRTTKLNARICAVCDCPGELLMCEGVCGEFFHLACVGMIPQDVPSPNERWACACCREKLHCCFACGGTASTDASVEPLRPCGVPRCGKFYHSGCIENLRLCGFIPGADEALTFRCPRHYCATCSSEEVKPKKGNTGGILGHCHSCPNSFHIKCMANVKGFVDKWKPSYVPPQPPDKYKLEVKRITRGKVFCPPCLHKAKRTEKGKLALEKADQHVEESLVRPPIVKKPRHKKTKAQMQAAAKEQDIPPRDDEPPGLFHPTGYRHSSAAWRYFKRTKEKGHLLHKAWCRICGKWVKTQHTIAPLATHLRTHDIILRDVPAAPPMPKKSTDSKKSIAFFDSKKFEEWKGEYKTKMNNDVLFEKFLAAVMLLMKDNSLDKMGLQEHLERELADQAFCLLWSLSTGEGEDSWPPEELQQLHEYVEALLLAEASYSKENSKDNWKENSDMPPLEDDNPLATPKKKKSKKSKKKTPKSDKKQPTLPFWSKFETGASWAEGRRKKEDKVSRKVKFTFDGEVVGQFTTKMHVMRKAAVGESDGHKAVIKWGGRNQGKKKEEKEHVSEEEEEEGEEETAPSPWTRDDKHTALEAFHTFVKSPGVIGKYLSVWAWVSLEVLQGRQSSQRVKTFASKLGASKLAAASEAPRIRHVHCKFTFEGDLVDERYDVPTRRGTSVGTLPLALIPEDDEDEEMDDPEVRHVGRKKRVLFQSPSKPNKDARSNSPTSSSFCSSSTSSSSSSSSSVDIVTSDIASSSPPSSPVPSSLAHASPTSPPACSDPSSPPPPSFSSSSSESFSSASSASASSPSSSSSSPSSFSPSSSSSSLSSVSTAVLDETTLSSQPVVTAPPITSTDTGVGLTSSSDDS